jgi:hypothetical protein
MLGIDGIAAVEAKFFVPDKALLRLTLDLLNMGLEFHSG